MEKRGLGGIPHAPPMNDTYNSYLIAASTSISPSVYDVNYWAIDRHPHEFADPDHFKPERYLPCNRLPYPNKKHYNTFDWGRPQCSGPGQKIPMDIFPYTNSENVRLQPFKPRFIPRT
jgi:hypothetical protein